MNVVVTVSGYIIPAVMLFIVIHGMIKKVNVSTTVKHLLKRQTVHI